MFITDKLLFAQPKAKKQKVTHSEIPRDVLRAPQWERGGGRAKPFLNYNASSYSMNHIQKPKLVTFLA